MKIGILGSRGIPNHYGGFEQFAEFLAPELVKLGAQAWVYNSHTHPYREKAWKGVNLIHCYDPEDSIGTAGQFIYDLNCILDSRKRNFDIILQLGYTSNSIWYWLLPSAPRIITNMDGLEWKRNKYSKPVRAFLKYAEKLAVKSSDILIADSEAIKEYIKAEYKRSSVFIPYGAEIPNEYNIKLIDKFNIEPDSYYLLIARMQADNHVEEIITGFLNSESEIPLVVVGSTMNKYGQSLVKKFQNQKVIFTEGIFDRDILNSLRHYCRLYFHGHSSGGTNPSLLEAMAASALICAHDNPFNRSVLKDNAWYFSSEQDISLLIKKFDKEPDKQQKIANNILKIKQKYNWDKIVNDYWQLFKDIES
jgi:glycosyltransferase involved in cell wall biosynthesis